MQKFGTTSYIAIKATVAVCMYACTFKRIPICVFVSTFSFLFTIMLQ